MARVRSHRAGRLAPVERLSSATGRWPCSAPSRRFSPTITSGCGPIPLWIRGAGVAAGPYRELVETALAILDATDPALLFDAMFALEQLDELAFDPRAYDFDHPVNKRPNYLFGQWDMNQLDNAGRCRRFVLQQVTLDAMLDRLTRHGRLPRKQVLFEEAAVLAGTMLMGSGVSGNRPDAHDSTVTLATLVEKIAVYRDAFYESAAAKTDRPARRAAARRGAVAAAAVRRRAATLQPFSGAAAGPAVAARPRGATVRRHRLHRGGGAAGRRRARGLGPHDLRDALPPGRRRIWPSSAATCRGGRRVAAGRRPAARGDRVRGHGRPLEHPGFRRPVQPLSRHREQRPRPPRRRTARHDGRRSSPSTCGFTKRRPRPAKRPCNRRSPKTSPRWPAGGTSSPAIEVDSVDGISGQATLESAQHVAAALRAWHEGGAAAGDLAFWRQHVEQFRSPKAYALVIETLLDHRDPVAAMALLVQWLGQAEEIPLVEEDYSFHDLALVWMEDLWQRPASEAGGGCRRPSQPRFRPPRRFRRRATQRWPLARKFLDYLEANAEEYWHVPRFEMAAESPRRRSSRNAGRHAGSGRTKTTFSAQAYEHVTYRDSTDDGVEGEMFETGESATDFELVGEAERIVDRLNFLTTVAQLWKLCATASAPGDAADRDDVLAGWLDQAAGNHRQLLDLLAVGASLSDSAAARHARVAGRVRPPAERQGDAAGGDHRGVRRDGRRRADDPRVDGPSAGRGRDGPVGAAGRRSAGGRVARRRGRRAPRVGPSCCGCSTSSRCCTWPWAGAATRNGSSPRAASSTCCAAC